MRSTFNSANLSANSRSANVLQGNINEFIPTRAQVTFFLKSSASGIKATILASSDVAVDNAEIVAIGTTLTMADDGFETITVGPGTRLALFLQETAGSSTTDVIGAIDVQPF